MAATANLLDRWRSLRRRAYKKQPLSIGYPLARWWARPFALPISAALARLRLSPHSVTCFSLFLALAAAATLAFAPFPQSLYLGTTLLFLWYLADHVDGQVARLTDRTSAGGSYFDFYMHGTVHPLAAWAVARCAQEAMTMSAAAPHAFPLLFFFGQLALEAHRIAEAQTAVKMDSPRQETGSAKGYRPWRWLFRLCEFPNVLPQLAALAALTWVDAKLGAIILSSWATASGALALVLAAARLLRRVRSLDPSVPRPSGTTPVGGSGHAGVKRRANAG